MESAMNNIYIVSEIFLSYNRVRLIVSRIHLTKGRLDFLQRLL